MSYYFGKEKAELYGDKVISRLKGRIISKRIEDAKKPGGIAYEAESLGINEGFDAFELLETLEGLCYLGRVIETDDSHYKVLG